MRQTFGRIIRVLCAVILIVAALPISATEKLCVIPGRAPAPMAAHACGMACCRMAAPPVHSCCHHESAAASGSMTCRCVVHSVSTPPVPAAVLSHHFSYAATAVAIMPAAPASLSAPLRVNVCRRVRIRDPGWRCDSLRSPSLGRAPPIS